MEQDAEERHDPAVAGDDRHFALVGWYGVKLGDRFVLKLQGYRSREERERKGVEVSEFFLTRNQAAQLGHYLFQVSEQTPPEAPRRGWLRRLLGSRRAR